MDTKTFFSSKLMIASAERQNGTMNGESVSHRGAPVSRFKVLEIQNYLYREKKLCNIVVMLYPENAKRLNCG